MVRNKCAIQVTSCLISFDTLLWLHFFLLHDSHHALLSSTYFEKTVKSSALSILSLCAIFFMFKVRGSSMKRGSFNKKRSVKRKSTKVCVLIISEGRLLFASQSSLCHWSQQHYRMMMSELLIFTDALISSYYFGQSQYRYVQYYFNV